jgi:uncharacterized protein YndB with AHSA1/START domain
MRWVVIVAGAAIAIVALMAVGGMLMPRTHTATRIARFHQPPEAIWRTITDYATFPEWRSNVTRVESLPSTNGLPAHREWDRRGHVLPMETVEWDPPRRCVGRIADPKLPFGGTWTFEIAPVPGGSTLRITENGEVRPPIFRFLARFVFGYTGTIETYLTDLGRRFGETVQPEP